MRKELGSRFGVGGGEDVNGSRAFLLHLAEGTTFQGFLEPGDARLNREWRVDFAEQKAAFERHAQDTNQMIPQDLSQSSSLCCEGSYRAQ